MPLGFAPRLGTLHLNWARVFFATSICDDSTVTPKTCFADLLDHGILHIILKLPFLLGYC